MDERLLRRPEVLEIAGISKSKMHQLVAAGDFPQPRRLGPKTARWLLSEVHEWIDSRPNWNGAQAA